MKRRSIRAISLMCLLVVFLTACGGNKIVGTWSSDDGTKITFDSDGTGTWKDSSGSSDITWSTEGDTLKIKLNYKTHKFKYSFSGGQLLFHLDGINKTEYLTREE